MESTLQVAANRQANQKYSQATKIGGHFTTLWENCVYNQIVTKNVFHKLD